MPVSKAAVRRACAAVLAAGLLAEPGMAQQALVPTPPQTAGPFYPVKFPEDSDNDLASVRGAKGPAKGTVLHVSGRVLWSDGTPIPGAVVELWQTDANGRYIHPGDNEGPPRDPNFQGYGRTTAAADGAYRFRTIRPVAYSGRTPHLHFAVRVPDGPRLITQMYVAGEALNARDGVYARMNARQREAVTVALAPATTGEPGALAGTFNLVLPR